MTKTPQPWGFLAGGHAICSMRVRRRSFSRSSSSQSFCCSATAINPSSRWICSIKLSHCGIAISLPHSHQFIPTGGRAGVWRVSTASSARAGPMPSATENTFSLPQRTLTASRRPVRCSRRRRRVRSSSRSPASCHHSRRTKSYERKLCSEIFVLPQARRAS